MGCVCCRDREKSDEEKLAPVSLLQRSPRLIEHASTRDSSIQEKKSLPASIDVKLTPEQIRDFNRILSTRRGLFALAKPRKSLIERERVKSAMSLGVRRRDSRVILGGLETFFQFTGKTLTHLAQAEHIKTKRNCWIQTCELKGEKSFKAMKQQVATLKSLDHPNVLKVLDVLREGSQLYVVYEATDGGTAEELKDPSKEADEQWVANVMRQVFAALHHCHSKGLEVNSLTLQHILFTEHSATSIKLLVPFNAELERSSPYVAPELVNDSYVIQANCLWSCGTILSALLIGELGVETRRHIGSERFQVAYTRWQEVSKPAKTLALALLSRDYRRRPSIEKCLQDPWIVAAQPKLTLIPSLRTALRNMAKLRPTTSLKKTFFQLMLDFVLPSEDLIEVKQAFRELDSDMDGTVSEEELRVQLFRLFPEEQAEAALTAITNTAVFSAGRKLGYSEFLIWACGRQVFTSTEHLNATFHLLDVDKDGEVSHKDMRELFSLEYEDKDDLHVWQVLVSSVSTSMERGFHFEEFSNYIQRP